MTARRPAFHPTAPANWMSDPNGPVFWRGSYHVFYQHNPDAPRWGLMHWGHLVSDDLLTWRDRGIAMRPQPGGPDADGCWSGCIRIIDGEPVAFYTGASGTGADHAQVVIRAVGDESLSVFTPDPPAPVVPAARGMGTFPQRDPFLLRWDDRWIMLLGTGLSEGEAGGAVVAWESFDTRRWTYRGVVFSLPADGSDIDTGPVWECPQLLQVDGRWVLIISVQLPGTPHPLCPYAVWFVGDFDGATFTPSASGLVDGGEVFYAPAVAVADGRPVLWAWVQESIGHRGKGDGEWAGAFALPRDLRVVDGRLVTAPVRETEHLWRAPARVLSGIAVTVDRPLELGEDSEDGYRLRLSGAGVGLRLILGRDGDGVEIALEVGGTDSAPLLTATVGVTEVGRLALGVAGGALDVYVDSTIVEVFGGGGALTFRVDPGIQAGVGAQVTTTGAPCVLDRIELAALRR